MRYHQVLPILLLLSLATVAQARRDILTIGESARQAEAIVVGDTRRGGDRDYNRYITVTEVIKGDAKLLGTEIVMSLEDLVSGDVYLPTPATGSAIVLGHGWKEKQRWSVLETYAKSAEIAALRLVMAVYALPGERERLLALREHALAGNTYCMSQLLMDMRDMREPANFDLMIDLYDVISPADQAKLLYIMGEMADPRAVPVLLKGMRSPDEWVSGTAAEKLFWYFPGAPGVTDAFENALTKKHLAWYADRYLGKRRVEAVRGPDTAWMHAEGLRNAGKMDQARAAYLAILESPGSSSSSRGAAYKLLPGASPVERDRIRKALLPKLTTIARSGNYLELKDAAQLLRILRHPDCLDALVAILPRTESDCVPAARTATLAIHELGVAARKQAVAALMGDLGPVSRSVRDTDARTAYMLALIYLADEEDMLKAASEMPQSLRASWNAAVPLRSVVSEADEGAALIQALEKPASLSRLARQWALWRLGDLKEHRAVKVLKEAMIGERDLAAARIARDALINIGSAEVETEMLAWLTHENHVREMAIEVLFGIQGQRGLDLARRMLHEDNFGLKDSAMIRLGAFGTADDLSLLLPYCDYWKSERVTHYRAVHAVATIRDRCNYDVNGPIVKTSTSR